MKVGGVPDAPRFFVWPGDVRRADLGAVLLAELVQEAGHYLVVKALHALATDS